MFRVPSLWLALTLGGLSTSFADVDCSSSGFHWSDQLDYGSSEQMKYEVKEIPPYGRVLVASGDIASRESVRLRSALRRARHVDEVWLISSGGISQEGIKMGKVLRAFKATVRIPRGAGCASACSVAFLGGAFRTVEQGAGYGVHFWGARPNKDLGRSIANAIRAGDEGDDAIIGAEIAKILTDTQSRNAAYRTSVRTQYLQEMGISLRWLEEWSSTRNKCMNWLSQRKMKSMLVTNFDE